MAENWKRLYKKYGRVRNGIIDGRKRDILILVIAAGIVLHGVYGIYSAARSFIEIRQLSSEYDVIVAELKNQYDSIWVPELSETRKELLEPIVSMIESKGNLMKLSLLSGFIRIVMGASIFMRRKWGFYSFFLLVLGQFPLMYIFKISAGPLTTYSLIQSLIYLVTMVYLFFKKDEFK